MASTGTTSSPPSSSEKDASNFSKSSSSAALDLADIDLDDFPELMEEFQNHDMVKGAMRILSQTSDLKDFSQKARQEIQSLQNDSLEEYLDAGRTQAVVELHQDVKVVDGILGTLSTMLSGFQEEMGVLSSQIQHLLDSSVTMRQKLENRDAVEMELQLITQNAVITEDLIDGIFNAPIADTYVKFLNLLEKKEAFVSVQKSFDGHGVQAIEEIEEMLTKLSTKAVERIRLFLLQKFYTLLKPHTNIQILQQAVLLRHKELYKFVLDHQPDVALELRNKYVEVVSNMFLTNFKLYLSTLLKHKLEEATKYDSIGVPETGKSRTGGFSLGDRAAFIFDGTDGNASIIPHIAASEQKKYHFERLFLSIERVLLDTVSSEVLFLRDFFGVDIFSSLFTSVVMLCDETLDSQLTNCFDCVGAMLMLVIVDQDISIMNKRAITSLDPYLAKATMKILTRLLGLLDSNISSLKSARPTDYGTLDLRPHYVTRKYAELAVAVNVLSPKLLNPAHTTRVNGKMKILCSQIKDFLFRLAAQITEDIKRAAFLINNFDLVLSILKERNLVEANEFVDFQEVFDMEVLKFVELELGLYFSGIIGFVKKKTQHPDLKVPAETITQYAKEFASKWKEIFKKINNDLMGYIPNFKTGALILSKCFTQVVLYYKRFEDSVKAQHKEVFAQLMNDFVPISTLTYEMKQYNTL